MQINNVSNLNFESSGYYLSPQARKNANALLQLMKDNTKHKMNTVNKRWETQILSSISMQKDIKFSNARLFINITDDPEKNKKIPDCILNIGKNILKFNSTTGEVLDYNVGFFSSLSHIVSRADKYIKDFLDNFGNQNVVKRNTFELNGYFEFVK